MLYYNSYTYYIPVYSYILYMCMYIFPTYFYQETRLETGRFWPAKCHRPDQSTALPQRRQGLGLGNLVAGRKLGHLVFFFLTWLGSSATRIQLPRSSSPLFPSLHLPSIRTHQVHERCIQSRSSWCLRICRGVTLATD